MIELLIIITELLIIIRFVGGLTILSAFGVNVRTVLTFSGVGGVAIGFAGRDLVANLLGGLTVYLTQPFTVGDWIHSEDKSLDGWVEEIGWYYTKINTWDKRPMYIPNSHFSKLIVINASRMSNRRVLQTLRLRLRDYGKIPIIVRDIRKVLVASDAFDPKQHRLVFFREVGPYSLDIWVSCFTRSVYFADYLDAQQSLLVQIGEIVASHGASFANTLVREQHVVEPRRAAPPRPPAARPPMAGMLRSAHTDATAESSSADGPSARAGAPTPGSPAAAQAAAAAAAAAPMEPPAGFSSAEALEQEELEAVLDPPGWPEELEGEERLPISESISEQAADELAQLEAARQALAFRSSALDEKEATIELQEAALLSFEASLSDQEGALRATEKSLEQQIKAIAAREHALRSQGEATRSKSRRAQAEGEAAASEQRAAAAENEEEALRLRKAATLRKLRSVRKKEESLSERRAAVEAKEAGLRATEEAMAVEKEVAESVKQGLRRELESALDSAVGKLQGELAETQARGGEGAEPAEYAGQAEGYAEQLEELEEEDTEWMVGTEYRRRPLQHLFFCLSDARGDSASSPPQPLTTAGASPQVRRGRERAAAAGRFREGSGKVRRGRERAAAAGAEDGQADRERRGGGVVGGRRGQGGGSFREGSGKVQGRFREGSGKVQGGGSFGGGGGGGGGGRAGVRRRGRRQLGGARRVRADPDGRLERNGLCGLRLRAAAWEGTGKGVQGAGAR